MSLDALLKAEKLFSFRFAEQPNSKNLLLEAIMITPGSYDLALHPKMHAGYVKGDEQEQSTVLHNMGVALIRSIGYCFSDQFEYGWIRDRPDVKDSYFAVLKSSQEAYPVAFLVPSEEPEVCCASEVKEFLQSNLDAIFLNIETVVGRSNNRDTPLKRPVKVMSAHSLLSGKVSYQPEKPRPSEYDSLDDYIASSRNGIRIGDVIYGVKLTGKHKKSGSGTFLVSYGKRQPITVIVQNSSPFDTVDIQFTEKINDAIHRAVQYTKI